MHVVQLSFFSLDYYSTLITLVTIYYINKQGSTKVDHLNFE